ncbi:P-loop containing nucleoside triphosphate hydrolase protein [Pisolithus tinctorius]|nr:P-loop containing nucleoside triphosphate hydrolase protein [Pisolithus tinctorius]
MTSLKFTVGLADAGDSGHRAAKRIIIHADVLKVSKLCSGDVVALRQVDDTANKHIAVGVLWPSLDIPQNSILISRSLLLTAHVTEGSLIHIFPLSGKPTGGATNWLPSLQNVREAKFVRLREIPAENAEGQSCPVLLESRGDKKRRDWLALSLREHLVGLKFLLTTQVVEVLYEGNFRRFRVETVSEKPSAGDIICALSDDVERLTVGPQLLWLTGWDTTVHILDAEKIDAAPHTRQLAESLHNNPAPDAYATVGGLDETIQQIKDLIEIPLTRPHLFEHFGLKPPRGILLHGPPGTGKTHLARAIATSTKSSVLVINGPELSSAYHGETEARLRDVFKEAWNRSPCIVVLDEVDALVPRREDGPGGEVEKRVVATLLTILDGMEDNGSQGRVVVIGTTNRPNSIDPALRRPGRFDREFEIGVPDAEARLAILQVLLAKAPHSISDGDLQSIASRAHGYVGADLNAVVREAGTIAIKRWMKHQTSLASEEPGSPTDLMLTSEDLADALPAVRPSALRSVFLETAPVRYSDIGGQVAATQKLREMVEWPLLHPEAFKRLGVRAPKGLLLYGPPGCSKTILARACATESGINFVAVRGPELLNKYVGESERAVREIFSRARAASPSIIFFDEIDALGTSRSGELDSAPSHEGVLTTLLNEMDGVQELIGVTIIAATNRPDAIDSALMRPGRLDRILYIGPPDQAGREEILRIRTRRMSVEEGLDIGVIASMTEGCSGAEIVGLCQEAALLTMQKDINAPSVPQSAFEAAARAIRRQLTPEIIQKYHDWSEKAGLRNA